MTDYFGQSPDGYQKPLYAASNFSDVVDKPTALTNLGAASSDDVLKAANPIGTIIAYYGATAPYGYLPCNGQTISSSTFPSLVSFLGGTTSATLPDLRGEFLRGWDNGRGVDIGRALRTAQTDLVKNHIHKDLGLVDNTAVPGISGVSNATLTSSVWGKVYGTSAGTLRSYLSTNTTNGFTGGGVGGLDSGPVSGGGTENRPRNVSVLFCIKAYDVAVSQGIVNISQLASELSAQIALKVDAAEFVGLNQSRLGNGYQKLPGGMIMQWGSTIVQANSTVTITYPINFNSVPITAQVSCGQATLSNVGTPGLGCSLLSNSQLMLQSTYTASFLLLYWFAIGY